jgi:hypothetical protein
LNNNKDIGAYILHYKIKNSDNRRWRKYEEDFDNDSVLQDAFKSRPKGDKQREKKARAG